LNIALTLEEIEKLEAGVDEVAIDCYASFNASVLTKLRAAHDNTTSAEERRLFALAAEGLPPVLSKALQPIVEELEASRRRELALLRVVVKLRLAADDLQASSTIPVTESGRG
jgi:hypothetical protein